ncbi:MAG: Ig-like domain-containing protein [Pyrinomonadaceae bacterium]|nr:Ig-like domain-containing protein [Pyrinomonadaceae bacterium]
MRRPTEQQSMAPNSDLETHLQTTETHSMRYLQPASILIAHSTRAARDAARAVNLFARCVLAGTQLTFKQLTLLAANWPARISRAAQALRHSKTFNLTHAVVLVLCYCLVVQPNAALATQPSLISAMPLTSTNPTAKTETTPVLTETANAANPSNPLAVPIPSPVAAITDAVVTRHKPTLTSGRIEGSVRVLLGESFAIPTSAQLLADLYLPGTPVVQLNSGAQHGGLVNDGGAATPTGYTVTLNSNVNLPGRIHTKADAVQLPADYPNSVPASTGTRNVTVRYASDIAAIGNWQTVRDVSVTGSGLTLNMPPGNYGTLTVNGNSQVNLSAGVYNFANTFNLDGSARLQSTGRVAINVAQNVTINSGALTLGSYTAPADVRLNVLGALLKINGSSQVNGLVRAYNAAVTLNNTAQLRGQVIADSFTLNGGKVIGAVWPVPSGSSMMIFGPRRFDRTTGPPNQYVEQFSLPSGVTSPYTLHIQNGEPNGSNRVSSATVKLNGIDILTPSDLNQNVAGLDRIVTLAANNQLDVRLASSPGSYLIINIIGAMPVSDTTPPTVAITAPANSTVTAESEISVSGTASDTGTGATGVAHVYVNDVEAAYNSSNGTWSIAAVPLTPGANPITARAVDNAGNPATTSITVTRETPENHAPDVNAGTDQSFTLPQTATLQGTATDDGLPQGSSLTTTWAMVSGPGEVTFANAQSLSTTASFSTAGTYVLSLSASDSALTKSDEITITVQPQNQPPTVSGGSDQTIALPRTAGLNGTVTDDGLPTGGTLSLMWSQVSGPGSVTFEAPTLAETTAAFSVAGEYVLKLSASDSDLSSHSEIKIIVQPENVAPTITAGSDQTITLPNGVQLNGSVSDDGWPAGSSLTCQWGVGSGPGPVTIDNPNVTVTMASFSFPGVYVFRLTCSDSELSSSDELTINVAPPPDTTAPSLNITSHTDNSTTPAETITVSGTVSDPGEYPSGVAQVTVNNVAASLDAQAGTWTLAGVALTVGPNTIIVRAVDNAGKDVTLTITINRAPPPDLQAPTLAITSPENNFISPDATITVTGTAVDEGPYATGVRRVTVNGQQATYDPATHVWTATGVALNEGPNTIQVLADDNATPTNTRDASISVTRHTPDTNAPTVTITSPMSTFETYDGTLSVAGTAVDDGLNATGVDRVTVNGVDANYNAATSQWSVAALALTYGDNHIVVIATDKAPTPNQGSANVHVTRIRIPPPTLTISNPQNGAVLAATSITVAGSVESLGTTPTVTVNGENAVVSGGQFARTVSLVEGANTITVVATDSIAQQSQASLSVIRDLSAPTVSFANVPASVQPGGTYQILVDATDNVGVADVEFRLNGQYVATVATAPYQFTLAVPSVYAAGANLVLSAVARDLTNTTAVATAQTRTGGPGGISGYVFDDTTGYVLQGVNVLLNSDGSVITDELGVFNLISSSPSGVVRLTKDGHTLVERSYSVSIGEGTALFDARLTPLDSQTNLIGVSGATANGDGGRLQVTFPAGTFDEPTDMRVTNVSPQGLANLLPYGWSPVPSAVVDLRPAPNSAAAPQAFPAPAHLTISQVSGLTSATPLTLVGYDETSHRWMVVSAGLYATATSGGGALSADLPRTGQYAFLVADTGPTAPPPPIVGQPLTAAQPADSAALDSAQASAVATPRTAVFSAAARSAISFFATAPTQLPSGVTIDATFGETYNLLGGRDSVLVDRPAQDFVLYAYPAATSDQPNRLGAFFVAKPTRTDFTLTELFNANVHVEIRSGRQTKLGALIDVNGGGVRASDGSQLTIPANAMSGSQSVFFNDLPPQLANVSLPDGYEIVGAFDVELGSAALNASATISVPAVGGDLSRIVVARLLTVGGQRSPKVVARAVVDSSGKLNSTIATPSVPAGVVLSGIRTSGRYLFIRVPQPFGYVKGSVIDASTSNPLGMVKVSGNQTPFIDVTSADGQFVVIGSAGVDAAGTNQVGAAALTTDATGKATASLNAQDAVANVNISVSAVPLQVDSITPAANAQNMIATTPVTVTFNKPVAATSVTGSSFTLSTASGNPVLGSITVLAGNRVVVFTPAATLAASTTFKVSLNQSVRDIYGHPLAAAFNSTFATAATVTVGNRLRPEQIVIGYPDANGMSSISLPAQSVPEGSTLLVVNTTSGSTLSTVAGTAALLLQIQARVGDEITLTISQPDGTQYRVTQAAYRRADGFISVGSNGGTITSDDGKILLSVPAGAISGQADIKLTSRAESDISIPRQGEMDPANVPFGAGVRINVAGNFTNDQELHLEVAAPPAATEGQRVFFMRPAKFTDAGGERDVWEVITSGKVEGGKFKTMSPPYSGVTIVSNLPAADYDVFMPRTFRAVTGKVTELVPNRAPRPLARVEVTIGPAQVIAYTAANGRFGTLDLSASAGNAALVTAKDSLGRTETATATPYISTDPSETGLNGLQTLYASIQFPSSAGLPETLPALLRLEGRMLDLTEGQPDTLQTVGRVVLGSHIEIKTIATPDVQQITGQLLIGGNTVQQLVWNRQSAAPGTGVLTTDFTVSTEGSYSVVVTTHTQSNVLTTRATSTFGFVALLNPNTRPSLEGPPRVVSVTPGDGAQQVGTAMRIHLEFSEPVKNLVPGQSVYLTDLATQQVISGEITSGGLPITATSPNISSIDFQPATGLEANKLYAVEVSTAVKDTDNHALDQDYTAPGDTDAQPFRSTFTTFRPMVLTDNPAAQPLSYRLATAGDLAITVVPTVTGSSLNVFDISDPQKPTVVGNKFVPFFATAYDIAEADQESDIITVETPVRRSYEVIAVALSYSVQDSERPVNLWIYSLDDPASPELIGVSSLKIPRSAPSYPMYVKIHHKRAYVGNSGKDSLEVVDLEEAVHTLAESSDPKTSWFPAVFNGFNAGYNQDAKKQRATYQRNLSETAPVYSLSVMDQAVPMPPNGPVQSPVVYVASNRLQLLSFDTNSSWDGRTTIVDSNPQDGIDDRLIGTKDLAPAGFAVDVRTAPGMTLNGQSTDIALLLGGDRLWLFNATNPRDPQQYQSRSFAELGLGTGSARRMDVEDTLVYVMFADKVAVIDFSDPAHLFVSAVITDLGTDLRWISVQDGFVYTLDLATGATGAVTSRLRSSIGAAAAVVYVHGQEPDGSACMNPVLISRAEDRMLQPAETVFKVYGHDAPQSAMVTIRKETRTGDQVFTTVLAEIPAVLETGGSQGVVVGRAAWTSGLPIDRAAIYTAELVIDANQPTEFRARRVPIVFSHLIDQYEEIFGVSVHRDGGKFAYILGGNANISLTVNGSPVNLADGPARSFGVHVESLKVSDLGNLSAGRHQFRLTASLRGNASVTEVAEGIVVVERDSPDKRQPGSIVVGGVEVESGNLALTHTDIPEIKNRGLSLSFTRFYNSQVSNTYNSLGYGWAHNYQMLLKHKPDITNPSDSIYVIEGGEGSGQNFKASKLPNAAAEAPYHGTLRKNSDNSFDFFTKANVKYHFNQALEVGSEELFNSGYMGNLSFIEEPNGNKLTLSYDTQGRLASVSDSSNRKLIFTYEQGETPFVGTLDTGTTSNTGVNCTNKRFLRSLRRRFALAQLGVAWRILKIIGPGGLTIDYQYDAKGNLARAERSGADEISQATGASLWSYAYDPSGGTNASTEHLLKSVQAPNHTATQSHITGYEYELTLGGWAVKASHLPENVNNSYSYSFSFSRISSADVTDGRGKLTRYQFSTTNDGDPSAPHKTVNVQAPRGAQSTIVFDGYGNKLTETDSEGLTTTSRFDERGNAIERTMSGPGASQTTRALFDQTFSKPVSVTDANNQTTFYHLDGRGNVTGITLPTGRVMTLDYAANGDLTGFLDQYGFASTLSYDGFGNATLISRQTSGAKKADTSYTYDLRSRPTGASGTLTATMTNEYDALDHVVRQTTVDPSAFRDTLVTTVSYLTEGQVRHSVQAGGTQHIDTTNAYDGLNRLVQTKEIIGGAGTFIRPFRYDENSNLLEETDRRGVVTKSSYDDLNFLATVIVEGAHGASRQTLQQDLDKVGNPTRQVNLYGQVTTLEYDGLHRLTKRNVPGAYNEAFSYDGNGNVLSQQDRKGRMTRMSYDPMNRLREIHDPQGRIVTISYDDATRTTTRASSPQGLTEILQEDALARPLKREVSFDGNRYVTTYSYDGRTMRVIDPRAAETVSELSSYGDVGHLSVVGAVPAYALDKRYAALGGLKTATDALSRTTDYTLDSLNRATQVAYPGGFSESVSYDGGGLVQSHTDKRGSVSTKTYDNLGRELLIRVADAEQTVDVMTATYDDVQSKETKRDANGREIVLSYDGLHRLVSVRNADGKTMNYVYDGVNRTSESDFMGRTTTFQHDNADRVVAIHDRKGQVTLLQHNDNGGYTRTVTDRRGQRKISQYDALGRLLSEVDGGQPLATYEYDGNNNRIAMIDGRNHRTAYTYDKLNRPTSIDHASVQTETFVYDAVGNVLRQNDGRGPDAVMEYDALNHLKKRTDGAGNTTFFVYDGEGLLTERTDPKGAAYKTSYTYNGLGSLKSVRDASGGAWSFAYDPAQNLKSVKDALDRTVSYEYDVLDRLVTVTQPQTLVTTYGYDANSNRTSVTDAKGQTSAITYDALDRPVNLAYGNTNGPGPRSYAYDYDPEGNLTSVNESAILNGATPISRSYARTYDERSRVKTTTNPFGHRVSFDYDAANNLTLLTDSANKPTAYAYDARNRLQTATLPGGGGTATYTWHVDGLLQRVAYGNGQQRDYQYDNADRATRITNMVSGSESSAFDYEYDANSNRKSETRKLNGAITRAVTYDYDLLDRLTRADYQSLGQRPANPAPGASVSYSEGTRLTGFDYDRVGNRTTATARDRTTTITLSTNAEGETTESRQNADGQLFTSTAQFDDLNRLTQLTEGSVETLYGYDRNGNLTEKKQNNLVTASYEYDARDQLRRVLNGSQQELAAYDYDHTRRRLQRSVNGSNTLRYVYAGDDVVNEYAVNGNVDRLINRYDLGAGEVVRGEFENEGSRFYFSDALGSTTALSQLTQGTASVSARYEYDAWGQIMGGSGASFNQIGYTGQRLDGETGLMPLGNGERYYSPSSGSFIQQDSFTGMAMMAQSMNRYAYVHNNPLRFSDPTGHLSEENRGTIAQSAREYGINKNGETSTLGIIKNTLARSGYDAWNFISFGALERQEETVAQLDNGEITVEQFEQKTTANVLISFAQLELAILTGGAGAGLAGAGLTTRVLAGAGLATGEKFLNESLEMAGGFRESYSSPGSYALTGGMGATFGAAMPGRAQSRVHAEGRASVVSDLRALKTEVTDLSRKAGNALDDYAAKSSGTALRQIQSGRRSELGALGERPATTKNATEYIGSERQLTEPSVSYQIDENGLTIQAEGRITGPHQGRGKGYRPEPLGGRSMGEHRGHLIPEGGVADPSLVNVRANIISEAPGSNLGPKKAFDHLVSRTAAENPGSTVRSVHQPLRRANEARPFAVTHWIKQDGKFVHGVTIFNR